jgi:type I restriction enzyme R subunit
MKFNEDSRVKIPALLHFTRLGYGYLAWKTAARDSTTNIFPEIFKSSIQQINPQASAAEIDQALTQATLLLDNEDLGKAFYERLTSSTGIRLIDFDPAPEN